MLDGIELYASACYDNTQRHLTNIGALSTVEEILAYDYTLGYPEKLEGSDAYISCHISRDGACLSRLHEGSGSIPCLFLYLPHTMPWASTSGFFPALVIHGNVCGRQFIP